MQTTEAPLVDPDALYRLKDVIGQPSPETGKRTDAIVPISSATVYRWIERGEFPAPIRLGANTVAWRGSDLNEWLEARRSAGVQTQSAK